MAKDDNNNKKMFQNLGLIMAGLFYIVSCVMVYINTTGGKILNSDIETITFAHWQLEDGFREGYAEAIKQFEEYKKSQGQKVKVVQTTVPFRGYTQWFLTQLIGGDPADIIELRGASALRNRYFVPLSRYIGNPNPFNAGTPMSGVPWKDTFIDNMNGGLDSSFGEYFGIGAFTATYRVYVNINLLEKATGSRKLPKTLKQWMDACAKMREYGEKIGKSIIPIGVRGFDKGTLYYLFQNYFSQTNSDLNDKISQNCSPDLSAYDVWQQLAENKLDKEKLLAAVDIVREIGQNFGAGFMATDLEQTKFLFFSGKVGFFPEGTWNAYSMVKNAPFEVAIMQLPTIAQDHKYSKYFVGAPTEQGARISCLFGIPKASKNFDLALEFLQFVSSWKINNMIMVDYCKWLPAVRKAQYKGILKYCKPQIGSGRKSSYPPFMRTGKSRTKMLESLENIIINNSAMPQEFFYSEFTKRIPLLINEIKETNLSLRRSFFSIEKNRVSLAAGLLRNDISENEKVGLNLQYSMLEEKLVNNYKRMVTNAMQSLNIIRNKEDGEENGD